jgi:hypothetical protein
VKQAWNEAIAFELLGALLGIGKADTRDKGISGVLAVNLDI